jgi:hypothetical protein
MNIMATETDHLYPLISARETPRAGFGWRPTWTGAYAARARRVLNARPGRVPVDAILFLLAVIAFEAILIGTIITA